MARYFRFAIATLIAAGLTPLASTSGQSANDSTETDRSLLNSLKKIVANIGNSHRFTMAQHQSHQSHGSHQSHRSSSHRITPEDGAAVLQASAGSRNEASTPYNSVLPSTPAIAKKLKILPGNTRRFRELVTKTQVALLASGYEPGEVNGEIHARTVAALYRYQADKGFVPTGKVTGETLSSLGITAQ
jgi:His-Xaa-Ser repeat protein HxsA